MGVVIIEGEGAVLEVNLGRPILTNRDCSIVVWKCVNQSSCRLGGKCSQWRAGSTCPKGKERFGRFSPIGLNDFFAVCLNHKCIRLVREKLTIFPYGQCIVGSGVSLAFRRYSQVVGRWWGLREICKNVTPISH